MTGQDWHDGIPKEPGWYEILLEGEEVTRAKLWQCQLNCKWWWILEDGVRVPPADVKWGVRIAQNQMGVYRNTTFTGEWP